MDLTDFAFPAIIALFIGAVIWGVMRAMGGSGNREKRKLAERLSNEVKATQSVSTSTRSIQRRLDVVGLPPSLAAHPMIQALNRRLVQAYPGASMARFLGIVAVGSLLGLIIAILVSGALLGGIVGFAAGMYAPFFVLSGKRKKRQRMIAMQLPEALDFLSRVLKAGHSFSSGLQMMSDELPAPLSDEMRRCYDQHSLGQSLDDSLRDASLRIESSDFAFFVTALLIQRQTGGDLSEVLKNISNMIRSRVRLAQQVKAKTAEGRFTGYILVAFPAVMFGLVYVQNPTYCGKLLTGSGLYLLGTALLLQMMGLYFIRRITTIRV